MKSSRTSSESLQNYENDFKNKKKHINIFEKTILKYVHRQRSTERNTFLFLNKQHPSTKSALSRDRCGDSRGGGVEKFPYKRRNPWRILQTRIDRCEILQSFDFRKLHWTFPGYRLVLVPSSYYRFQNRFLRKSLIKISFYFIIRSKF